MRRRSADDVNTVPLYMTSRWQLDIRRHQDSDNPIHSSAATSTSSEICD